MSLYAKEATTEIPDVFLNNARLKTVNLD